MPVLYDRRVIESKPGRYWQLQEYLPCDCPDCEADAHWMFASGTPSCDEARKWQQDIDSKRNGLHRRHDAEAAGGQDATA